MGAAHERATRRKRLMKVSPEKAAEQAYAALATVVK